VRGGPSSSRLGSALGLSQPLSGFPADLRCAALFHPAAIPETHSRRGFPSHPSAHPSRGRSPSGVSPFAPAGLPQTGGRSSSLRPRPDSASRSPRHQPKPHPQSRSPHPKVRLPGDESPVRSRARPTDATRLGRPTSPRGPLSRDLLSRAFSAHASDPRTHPTRRRGLAPKDSPPTPDRVHPAPSPLGSPAARRLRTIPACPSRRATLRSSRPCERSTQPREAPLPAPTNPRHAAPGGRLRDHDARRLRGVGPARRRPDPSRDRAAPSLTGRRSYPPDLGAPRRPARRSPRHPGLRGLGARAQRLLPARIASAGSLRPSRTAQGACSSEVPDLVADLVTSSTRSA
jgi:hypothetical protein